MEQQIIAGLMARGIPHHIAVGMTANMIAESGLNPGINEIAPIVPGSRGGYGLNQWTGPRRRQYETFAGERGAPLDDLNTQLDFTVWELQNTEKNAWGALSGADTAEEAAALYSDKFLRPGIPHMDRRLSEARRLAGMDMDNPQVPNALAGAPATPQEQQNTLAEPRQPQLQWNAMQIDPNAFAQAPRAVNRLALTPYSYGAPYGA